MLDMKICQIAPYGGEPKWQRLGFKISPEIRWLIILTNNSSDGGKNFLVEAQNLVNDLERSQDDFPESQKTRLSLIDLTSVKDDYFQLLGCIFQLFSMIASQGYYIQVNASSGLALWRLILYQAALSDKSQVTSYFIFNKLTGEPIEIWQPASLTDADEEVLNILKSFDSLSLTDLQSKFQNRKGKGSLSYMVKIIKKLSKLGYVEEFKIGRVKKVSLSHVGKVITGVMDYSSVLEPISR